MDMPPKVEVIQRMEQVSAPAYVKYKRFWQTDHFRYAAADFNKFGYYCPFPEGTNAYQEYWDEHDFYIRNGIEIDGQRVAGLMHLYVNFCPIWHKKEKRQDFPNFRGPDAEWFGEIERAMALGPYANDFTRPSVHATGKTRQSGHSLKGCVPLLYNTHFVPRSKNYLASYDKSHAIKTNNMFWIYWAHLLEHTDFRKRVIKRDTDNYYKFGLRKDVKGVETDAGYQSELFILSFQDKATKGVGGGVDLCVIEEAGTFPKVIDAVQFMQNAVKDGDLTTGTILVYGAAGNLNDAMQFERLCMNPQNYDAFAYENIWDKTVRNNKKVAYFVPNYSCRPPWIDKDGNPDEAAAIIAREKNYVKLKVEDYGAYLQKVSQEPNNFREMFDVRMKTRFDREMINAQIAVLEANPSLLGDGIELSMNPMSKKVEMKFSNARIIREYPIVDIPDGDKAGCIEQYESPVPHDGPPGTRYIASIDSYNFDDSTTDSYGYCVIYEKATGVMEGLGRRIVCDYLGRPQGKEGKYEFYKRCLYMLLYYNALCLHENEDQELTPWFYTKGFDHLLCDQPQIILNYIPKSKVSRSKGINASEELIVAADNKIDRSFKRQIGHERDEQGTIIREIRGIDTFRQLGLLREAYRYVRMEGLNFDRIRGYGWVLMMEEESIAMEDSNETNDEWSDFLNGTSPDARLGTKGLDYGPGTQDLTRELGWSTRLKGDDY